MSSSSSNRSKKAKLSRLTRICVACVIAFAVGCYMLFVVSKSYRPYLGNTFHILVGCVLIAVSGLVLTVTLKNHFFPKKKSKRSNVVFLEDELRKKEAEDSKPQ